MGAILRRYVDPPGGAITHYYYYYGMTQGAIGIEVSNENDAKDISSALQSETFKEILDACMWGNFRIDWRLFTFFKREFYKDFLK
jgi:hypothetical protein